MKVFKLIGIIALIFVSAVAGASLKFTQSFQNGVGVVVPSTNGIMTSACTNLVNETPNPTAGSGILYYDCANLGYAFSVSNNTVLATPTFTINYTNPCDTCNVFVSLVDVNRIQYYTLFYPNSGDRLTSGMGVTFSYNLNTGSGHSDFYKYIVSYNNFVNGTTITLGPISWA